MNQALKPNTSLSHYRIVSKIGEGGMGEVYLAQDTRLDRKVALKILPAEVAVHPDRMKRFVQEARAASALNHPNIITIHEIDETESGHFIATEFIDGETLREREQKPLNLGESLDIATQIAGALAAAHAAGIVHRDVKPENVMIRRDGFVKVLDFGLAKLTDRVLVDSIEAVCRATICQPQSRFIQTFVMHNARLISVPSTVAHAVMRSLVTAVSPYARTFRSSLSYRPRIAFSAWRTSLITSPGKVLLSSRVAA